MGEEAKFTFQFTVNELNTIMAGLAELPFKVSSNLIQNVSTQYQEQVNKPAE